MWDHLHAILAAQHKLRVCMNISPHPALLDVLRKAYLPCSNIDVCSGVCREAKWRPACGHIPRGFLGATGDLEEVELVMLFAEPSDPHGDECYDPEADPNELLAASVKHAYGCFSDCKDPIHRKTRWFMKRLYPDLSFDEQLRRVWIAQSRLCSRGSESDTICATRYLAPQIGLLQNARVVAFGGKAQRRMRRVAKHDGMNADWLCAHSLAARNLQEARPTWEKAIDDLLQHR